MGARTGQWAPALASWESVSLKSGTCTALGAARQAPSPPCKPRLDCPRGSRELGVTSQPPTLGLQGRMRVDPASEKQTRAWASTPLQRSREGVNRWGKGETGWTAAPSSAGARVRRRGTP